MKFKLSIILSVIFMMIGAQTVGATDYKNFLKAPYIKSTADFNLICDSPCAWQRSQLNKAFEIVKRDFKTIQSSLPISPELKPIDIHFGAKNWGFYGKECLKLAKKHGSETTFVDKKPDGKAIICTHADPLTTVQYNNSTFLDAALIKWLHFPPKTAAAPIEQKAHAIVPINAISTASVLNSEIPDSKLVETSGNITLFCEKGCRNSAVTPAEALSRLNNILNGVEQNFGASVPQQYKPVEIHIGFDSICSWIAPSYMQPPMPGGFTYIREDTVGGSVICLNSSFENVISGRSALVHEFTHLYFYVHRYSYEENIEEPLVGSITGYSPATQYAPGRTICDVAEMQSYLFEFCKKYNLEYAKIPLFIQRLAERRKSGVLTNAILREELANLNK